MNGIKSLIEYAQKSSFKQIVVLYEVLKQDPTFTDACKAEFGKADRYYLLTQLLHREDAYHPWLYERCREVERDRDEHLDLWSRGHYKSTIITFAGTIQEILCNPEITIAILSHTKKIARDFVSQIKQEFELNEDLRRIYPDVLHDDPKRNALVWSLDGGIIVKRKTNPKEATLEGHGLVDGMPTGKHFNLRIYDDVVTRESVNTPDQILKTTEAWELSQNLGVPGGNSRRWHIGTRYNYGDTWQVLIDRGVVTPRVYAATDNGGFDGNPVFLSRREWEQKKRDESDYTIACQQLQNPIAGGQQEFQPEWIRYYEVRPQVLNVYIMCDYAGSRNTGSSNTAMSVVGVDTQLNKYLLDGVCHKMNLSERWTAVKELHKKWVRAEGVQVVKVGYERFGAQSDIEHFETMMEIEKYFFSIEELNWPRDGDCAKDNRIRRLQPDFKNWRFFLPYTGDMTRAQRDAKASNKGHLISKQIRKVNQDKRVYDVAEHMIKNEYLFFPNTTLKDFLDATSRIYDMDVCAPMIYLEGALEPEAYDD
jgi:hypothetical protein